MSLFLGPRRRFLFRRFFLFGASLPALGVGVSDARVWRVSPRTLSPFAMPKRLLSTPAPVACPAHRTGTRAPRDDVDVGAKRRSDGTVANARASVAIIPAGEARDAA
tara:strand:+ start:11821 stop:12141 length:321 start_codon:yes stop_codon:yes gene_type:complete